MHDRIGTLAGTVWNHLDGKGKTNITSIPRALKEKAAMVNLALGWLAREDKIELIKSGDNIMV